MCDILNLINIIFVLLAWICVGNVIYFIFRYHFFVKRLKTQNHKSFDCVAVIESVKGLSDGRRQYMCARFYYKFHLFIAVILLGGFTLTSFALITKLFIQPAGFDIFLFSAFFIAMVIRGLIRFGFIRYTLGIRNYHLKCLFLETIGSPLTHILHLGICFSALVGHKVTWAGIDYQITGPFNVKVE